MNRTEEYAWFRAKPRADLTTWSTRYIFYPYETWPLYLISTNNLKSHKEKKTNMFLNVAVYHTNEI